MQIIIRCNFTYLNEYIKVERGNRYVAAKEKRRQTAEVKYQCMKFNPINSKVDIRFEWHVKGKHDSDNIAFAKKFVLDGLVDAGVLPNDGPKYVGNFEDVICRDVSKGNMDYVIVELIGV